jgi:hypothetical protein
MLCGQVTPRTIRSRAPDSKGGRFLRSADWSLQHSHGSEAGRVLPALLDAAKMNRLGVLVSFWHFVSADEDSVSISPVVERALADQDIPSGIREYLRSSLDS